MNVNGWLFTDADNTLWDTNRVFAEAQLGLLESVEQFSGQRAHHDDRLAFVRTHDQRIAAKDHRGLKYPPAFLVQALWADLAGKLGAPDDVVASIVADYFTNLSKQADLRPGVKEALPALHAKGVEISIVSEGKRERVLETLAAHGLEAYITRTVTGEKSADMFRRLLKLADNPVNAVVVGDQLDRDVAFAKAAGLTAVYFPGGFTPEWTDHKLLVHADATIADFRDLIPMFDEQT